MFDPKILGGQKLWAFCGDGSKKALRGSAPVRVFNQSQLTAALAAKEAAQRQRQPGRRCHFVHGPRSGAVSPHP